MELTLEKKLEIVNAVNTAIARGHGVKVGPTFVAGAFFSNKGQIVYILHGTPEKPIRHIVASSGSPVSIVKTEEVVVDIIYDSTVATASK